MSKFSVAATTVENLSHPSNPIKTGMGDQSKTLACRAKDLLDKGALTDVVFVVGEEGEMENVPGHRLILAINSPCFQDMFFGEGKENVSEVRVPDVPPKIFKQLVTWCYSDYPKVQFDTLEDALNTYFAATKYAVFSLQEKSKMYIANSLSRDNVLKIFEFASQTEIYDVIYNCLKMIDKNIKDILESENFTTCKLGTVVSIVRRYSLDISSEGCILDAVVRWGKAECKRQSIDDADNLRKVIESALPHIRFLTMSSEELVAATEKYGIPSADEMPSLLVRISNPETALFPMGESLCNEVKQRKFVSNYWFTFRHATHMDVEELTPNDSFSGTVEVTGANIYFFGFLFPKFNQVGGLTLKVKCASGAVTVEGDVTPNKVVKTPSFAAYYIALPKCVYVKDGSELKLEVEVKRCLPNFQYLNIANKELTDEHNGIRMKLRATKDGDSPPRMICIPEVLVFF